MGFRSRCKIASARWAAFSKNIHYGQIDGSRACAACRAQPSPECVATSSGQTRCPRNRRSGSVAMVVPDHFSSFDARGRVLGVLEENPGASLRMIASLAKVSPETVRAVRRSVDVPGCESNASDPTGSAVVPIDRSPSESRARTIKTEGFPNCGPGWKPDIALSTCASAERLLDWLSSGSVVFQWPDFAREVPLSRIYEVADECRRRSQAWLAFAAALEARAKPTNAVAG